MNALLGLTKNQIKTLTLDQTRALLARKGYSLDITMGGYSPFGTTYGVVKDGVARLLTVSEILNLLSSTNQ